MNDKIRRCALLATAAGQGGGFDIDNYLTIVALEDGLTAQLSRDVEYCIDGNSNWTTLTAGTASPAINTGQTLSFRGNLTPFSSKGVGTFTISKSCDLTGNCMSLLFGDNAKTNLSLSGKYYAFYKLFYNCSTIKNVSSNFLPATTLEHYCYGYMFQGCTSLTTAPELPATTLEYYCYYYMFNGCTSLTTAPALPATTLATNCYYYMFHGTNVLPDCSNINFSSSTIVASGGLRGLFAGTKVTDNDLRNILPINSNGKYYLPRTTLASFCYQSMFRDCTLLTTAPELPATTLASNCYERMFFNCTSLTTAPELPAITLVDNCYASMFNYCSQLNYIKAMFTTKPSNSYTDSWVYRVASSGTFVKNANATWSITAINAVPSGWTVVLYDPDVFTPQECLSLSIEADDISGKANSTTVYYTASVKGLDGDGNTITKTITGEDTVEVGQNTSTTNSVTKTVSYTYMGVTATTTIIQGSWVDASYTVNLNSQWQLSSTVSNPNSSLYEGVYQSYANKGVNNSGDSMYIDIDGCTNFKLYIRSYAESSWDYVMVSQLDKTLTYSSSYSDTTLVKAHTRGNQKSGTTINDYTLVEFTNIPSGSHRIQIIYRKDSSGNSGDDRGYVLIPKNQ